MGQQRHCSQGERQQPVPAAEAGGREPARNPCTPCCPPHRCCTRLLRQRPSCTRQHSWRVPGAPAAPVRLGPRPDEQQQGGVGQQEGGGQQGSSERRRRAGLRTRGWDTQVAGQVATVAQSGCVRHGMVADAGACTDRGTPGPPGCLPARRRPLLAPPRLRPAWLTRLSGYKAAPRGGRRRALGRPPAASEAPPPAGLAGPALPHAQKGAGRAEPCTLERRRATYERGAV